MAKRRDLFRLAGLGLLGMAPGLSATGKALPNVTLSAGQAKTIKEPFGDLKIYFEGPTDQLKSMTAGSLRLKPGMTPHPPHEHPEEEFMVVTEGTGEIMVDGKTTKVGPGGMMYCAAEKSHGIVNTGKTPMMFYFYKWMA
jgi:quercetin dioxygenase-like cupin family protein